MFHRTRLHVSNQDFRLIDRGVAGVHHIAGDGASHQLRMEKRYGGERRDENYSGTYASKERRKAHEELLKNWLG
jgi:hypothetical protein